MCSNLMKLGDNETFEKITALILIEILNKIKIYNNEPTSHNFFLIKNYIIFFMIMTINLKNYPSFVKTIFIGRKLFFKSLLDSIKTIQKRKKRTQLFSILNYLFLEEYKGLYFNKAAEEEEVGNVLEKIFIEQQLIFSSMELSISGYDTATYKKIIDTLLKFDLSYDNFFKSYKNINFEEKPEYKLHIAQSIIRVAFSKEKVIYTKEKNYEYNFIKRVIEKDVEETFNKYDNNFRTLLRKEDLCDDVIKYMFFTFGNSMLIESFIKPCKKLLKNAGLDENCNIISEEDNKKNISIEEFNSFFDEMIKGLFENTPHVIRILLKIFFNSIRKNFSVKENDYNALYTALFFNFIINPRIQMLYSIHPHKSHFVRFLNKLVWKAIYNSKFEDDDDEYVIYNETIGINNKKIKNFIEQKIISIDENSEEVKNSLNDLFTEKYLIYPKFLFYVDSNFLCGTIEGGEEKIIDFHEIEINKK